MAGRPSKNLRELVRGGTFIAHRHGHLLASQPVPWPALAELQQLYQVAVSEFEQKAIAVEFGKIVASAHNEASTRTSGRRRQGPYLEAAMLKLGPHGSAQQVRRFFPRYLTLENGEPFRLQRWEQDLTREAYKRDQKGRRIYKEITLGIARGNGKTPFASGLGLHNLLTAAFITGEIPEIKQAAGSKLQASFGTRHAIRWVGQEESELAEWVRVATRELHLRDREGRYTIQSADGRMAHGGRETMTLLDEWWLMMSEREEEVDVAFRTAVDKMPDSFLFRTSTAGYKKDTQLGRAFDKHMALADIEHRREGFLTIARDLENGSLLWWYGMPEGYELDLENDKAVLRALRLANPSSFVDCGALLKALRRSEDPYNWIRLHLNCWTKTRDAWLPLGCFAGLRVHEPIPEGSWIFVAVDAALKHDTTAVVWAAHTPAGIQLDGRAWAARDGAPAHEHHKDGRISNRAVMEWIDKQLGGHYRIKEIVADPRFFDDYIWELGQRGYTVAEFAQNSAAMRDAEQHFYLAATAGEFSWYDPDAIFPLHIEATGARATRYGYKLENPEKSRPIDLATAAIMALERCTLGGRKPTSIYSKRGIMTL